MTRAMCVGSVASGPGVCKMPGDDCPLSSFVVFSVQSGESVATYALSAQVARDRCVQTAVPDGPSDVRCVSFSSSYRVVHAIVQSLQNAESATSNSGSGAVCLLLLCNPCIATYNVSQVEDKLAVNTSIHHSNTWNFKLFLSIQPIEMKMHYVKGTHLFASRSSESMTTRREPQPCLTRLARKVDLEETVWVE